MNTKHPWEEEYEQCRLREIHEMNVNQTNEIYRLKKEKNKLKNQILELRKKLEDEKRQSKLDEGSIADTISIITMRRIDGLRKKLEKETDPVIQNKIQGRMTVLQSALVLLNSPDTDKSLIGRLKKFIGGLSSI